VTFLYNKLLYRDPDPGGLAHWSNEIMKRRGDPVEAARGVSFSWERRYRMVQNIIREIYGREAPHEEIKKHTDSKLSFDQIVNFLVQEQEFIDLVQPMPYGLPLKQPEDTAELYSCWGDAEDAQLIGSTKVDNYTWQTEVLGSDVPVLAVFMADWCSACRHFEPIVKECEQHFGTKIKVVKADDRSLVTQYKVRGIPQAFVFDHGRQHHRFEAGVVSLRKLVDKLNEVIR
jgi:thioredoxin 1